MGLEESDMPDPASDKKYIELYTVELKGVNERLCGIEKALKEIVSLGVEMKHAKEQIKKHDNQIEEVFKRFGPVEAACIACADKNKVAPHWWGVAIAVGMGVVVLFTHYHLVSVLEKVLAK